MNITTFTTIGVDDRNPQSTNYVTNTSAPLAAKALNWSESFKALAGQMNRAITAFGLPLLVRKCVRQQSFQQKNHIAIGSDHRLERCRDLLAARLFSLRLQVGDVQGLCWSRYY